MGNSRQAELYDISVLISPETVTYPGDPGVSISKSLSTAGGDLANVYLVSMGTHTGTHIDAPNHIDDNWPILQEVDLTALLGPATVFQLDVPTAITAADLAGLPWEGVERVLLKTRNSQLWDGRFHADFVYLEDEAARFLTQHTTVRLVGIDYLSIERFGAGELSAHRELLSHGVLALEGLDLSGVPAGEYELICLPLRLSTPDAAPVRAVLRRYHPR